MAGSLSVCVSGALGAIGRVLVPAIAATGDLALHSAVSRRETGRDVGEALAGAPLGIALESDLEAALDRAPDVLVDYTHPAVVRRHVALALERRIPVVIGTSGLADDDFAAIDAAARAAGVGVASGNFSLTAALLQHLGKIAARHVPRFEIIELNGVAKPDVPSGTARELAELLAREREQLPEPAVELIGPPEARGAAIAGVPVHSLRLPGGGAAVEVLFGAPGERLTIRHEEQGDPSIFVVGTLLAARRVQNFNGLVRGLDSLLFPG
ncbi:MAG: 4-hydroxy-tetrahydrodipicolinate reductase [Gaiellales bacterium]|nr:4-hydroxy-tetrahydrodipicolinate reductase [Gaiellales bacterium]